MNIQTTYSLLALGAYFDTRKGVYFDGIKKIDQDNRAPIPLGWKVLKEFDRSGSGIFTPSDPNDPVKTQKERAAFEARKGFTARVYQEKSTGKIVISYAGTEFGTGKAARADWHAANVPNAIGYFAEQPC